MRRTLAAAGVCVWIAGCTGASSAPPPAPPTSASASPSIAKGPPPPLTAIAVSPDHGLSDGQQVLVSVSGFGPGAKVFLSECAPNQPPETKTGCGQQFAAEPFVVTDNEGRGQTQFTVHWKVGGHQCAPLCRVTAVSDGTGATVPIHFRIQVQNGSAH